MKKFFSTLVAVIVLVSVPIVAGAEKSADPMSKLGPRLHEKVKAHREKRSLDRVPSMRTEQETVRVILEARQAQEAIDQLKSLGGKIETSYGRFIQVVLPLSSVEEAAGIPQVRSMDLPAIAQEHALTSEGLPLIRVPAWHNRGLRGEGVGIIAPDGGGKPVLHIHAALGRGGRTLTGCLRPGVTTWLVGEAIIYEILGVDARRLFDEASGFNLLDV